MGFRAFKELSGITKIDSERPYGLMLNPRHNDHSFIWNLCVADILAAIYSSGGTMEIAVFRKKSKYNPRLTWYNFLSAGL